MRLRSRKLLLSKKKTKMSKEQLIRLSFQKLETLQKEDVRDKMIHRIMPIANTLNRLAFEEETVGTSAEEGSVKNILQHMTEKGELPVVSAGLNGINGNEKEFVNPAVFKQVMTPGKDAPGSNMDQLNQVQEHNAALHGICNQMHQEVDASVAWKSVEDQQVGSAMDNVENMHQDHGNDANSGGNHQEADGARLQKPIHPEQCYAHRVNQMDHEQSYYEADAELKGQGHQQSEGNSVGVLPSSSHPEVRCDQPKDSENTVDFSHAKFSPVVWYESMEQEAESLNTEYEHLQDGFQEIEKADANAILCTNGLNEDLNLYLEESSNSNEDLNLQPGTSNSYLSMEYTHDKLAIVDAHDKLDMVDAHDKLDMVDAHDKVAIVDAHDKLDMVDAHDKLDMVDAHDKLAMADAHDKLEF